MLDNEINKGVTVIEKAMTANLSLGGWFCFGLWSFFANDDAILHYWGGRHPRPSNL
jgi:hypothetical protein